MPMTEADRDSLLKVCRAPLSARTILLRSRDDRKTIGHRDQLRARGEVLSPHKKGPLGVAADGPQLFDWPRYPGVDDPCQQTRPVNWRKRRIWGRTGVRTTRMKAPSRMLRITGESTSRTKCTDNSGILKTRDAVN
jgi:hypothetical protein